MSHYSNTAENIGAHSAPQPASYFQAAYGMSSTQAQAASTASGHK